jgi:hypothetical protein
VGVHIFSLLESTTDSFLLFLRNGHRSSKSFQFWSPCRMTRTFLTSVTHSCTTRLSGGGLPWGTVPAPGFQDASLASVASVGNRTRHTLMAVLISNIVWGGGRDTNKQTKNPTFKKKI